MAVTPKGRQQGASIDELDRLENYEERRKLAQFAFDRFNTYEHRFWFRKITNPAPWVDRIADLLRKELTSLRQEMNRTGRTHIGDRKDRIDAGIKVRHSAVAVSPECPTQFTLCYGYAFDVARIVLEEAKKLGKADEEAFWRKRQEQSDAEHKRELQQRKQEHELARYRLEHELDGIRQAQKESEGVVFTEDRMRFRQVIDWPTGKVMFFNHSDIRSAEIEISDEKKRLPVSIVRDEEWPMFFTLKVTDRNGVEYQPSLDENAHVTLARILAWFDGEDPYGDLEGYVIEDARADDTETEYF